MGWPNAAPYSFFNIMGIDPPVVAVGLLPTPDGRLKDTANNIQATGEFVVNLVSEALAEAMNATCVDAPPDIDELEIVGLATAPSVKIEAAAYCRGSGGLRVPAARVRAARSQPVHCHRPNLQAHVGDEFVLDAEKHVFDTPQLKLIGSLHAAKWYARTSDRFAMERPTWAEWVKQGKV